MFETFYNGAIQDAIFWLENNQTKKTKTNKTFNSRVVMCITSYAYA